VKQWLQTSTQTFITHWIC